MQEKVSGWGMRGNGEFFEAFNTLLSAKGKNPFSRIVGNQEILTSIRYVITLDTDTQLPWNSAKKTYRCDHSPLNRPVSDPETR